MVIDMNETKPTTLGQVEAFLAGTVEAGFCATSAGEDDQGHQLRVLLAVATFRPMWPRTRPHCRPMQHCSIAALQQAQPGMYQTAMRENAGIHREGMQQAGETQRSSQRYDEANRVARDRLTLEQVAAGYQNRASDRMDRAQAELESAKTPEAQRSARQRLLGLMGKQDDDAWQGIALQGGTDAHGNKTDGILAAVNKRTGDMRRLDQGQGRGDIF
ncbi:MAG: hypothetical protein I8H87_09655 [Comamonadaceae bacterium]|jgi:hypothetical protein|nr:hypothetical protein [Comamonadaceae bacterium]